MEEKQIPTEEVKTLVRYLIEAEDLNQSIQDIRNEGLSLDSASNLFYNSFGNLFNVAGIIKRGVGTAVESFGKKVGLDDYLNNKHALSSPAQLLRDGLLYELSSPEHQAHLGGIFSGLMSWPSIADRIKSLGIDENSFPLLMTMLHREPIKADRIGIALADLIENPENPQHLKAVVNNIIELCCDKENIENATLLIDHVLRKCNDNLVNLPKIQKELDKFNEKLSYSDLDKNTRSTIEKQKEVSLTVIDQITLALKDFMPVIMKLNNKELVESILNHPKDLQNIVGGFIDADSATDKEKDKLQKAATSEVYKLLQNDDVIKAAKPLITKELVAEVLKLPEIAPLLAFDSNVKQIYNDTIVTLTELLTSNPDKLKAIISAINHQPEAETAAIINGVIEVIALGSSEQKAKVTGLISHLLPVIAKHKYPDVPDEVKEIEKQLLDAYVPFLEKERLAEKKIEILAKTFAPIDIVAYQCKPFNNVIAGLNDPEFLKTAFNHPKELQKVNEAILKFVFESPTEKESGQHLKEMVSAISDLITQKDVAEKAGPLFLKKLATDIFNLPKSANIRHYQKLTEDLAQNHPERFQDLARGLLSLPDELKRSLEATIDFTNLPPPLKYVRIDNEEQKLGYREVGIYVKDQSIMYKTQEGENKQLVLPNPDQLTNTAKLLEFLSNKDKTLEENLYDQLYAITHPEEKAKEDKIFDETIAIWVDISLKKETLPIVASMVNEQLVENIFELPKLKDKTINTDVLEDNIAQATAEVVSCITEDDDLVNQLPENYRTVIGAIAINTPPKPVLEKSPTKKVTEAQKTIATAVGNIPREALRDAIKENPFLTPAIDIALEKSGAKKTLNKIDLGAHDIKDLLIASLDKDKTLDDANKLLLDPSKYHSRVTKILKNNTKLFMKVCNYIVKVAKSFVKSLNPFQNKDIIKIRGAVAEGIELKDWAKIKPAKAAKSNLKAIDDISVRGLVSKTDRLAKAEKLDHELGQAKTTDDIPRESKKFNETMNIKPQPLHRYIKRSNKKEFILN